MDVTQEGKCMDPETKAIWGALARLLIARRVALSPEWTNRRRFAEDNGLSGKYRTLSDIETGRRDDYSPAILSLVEGAYRLRAGSIEKFLQSGGDPEHLAEVPSEVAPDPDPDDEAARAWIAAHPVEAMREVMRAAMRDPQVREQLGL